MKTLKLFLLSLVCVAIGYALGTVNATRDAGRSALVVTPSLEEKMMHHMRQTIRDGMPADELRKTLGEHLVTDNAEVPEVTREVFRNRTAGLQKGDSFMGFKAGRSTLLFQVREGKLVNVVPEMDFRPLKDFSPFAG